MMEKNKCKDCVAPCGKKSERCQPCSNKINAKCNLPQPPKLCEKCGTELAKRKYKLCHSCNMKARWADKEYSARVKTSIKTSFDIRWSDPSIRKKMIKVLSTFNGTSKLETFVAKYAKDYGFIQSVAIDKYFVDLVNQDEKIIVEVNGDVWHCNPKFWNADDLHPKKKVLAKDIWAKDLARKEALEQMGYKVFFMWEDDINKGKIPFIKSFLEETINEKHRRTLDNVAT